MTWRIACQEHLLPGTDLQEKWEHAQAAGFDGIELRGRGGLALERRRPELRAATTRGVQMPTVCVDMPHFLGDFAAERREDAIRQLSSQLSVIAELGGELVTTPASYGMFSRRLPPYEPPRSPAEDHAVLVDALGRLADHANREGVLICLEPLNRYEDYMVNTLAQAAALCVEINMPSLRIAADTYHMNIEEADPPTALRAAGPALGHVQLSDSNRLEPGAGHIDWAATFAALNDAGYTGWLAFECRLSSPPEDVLASSLRRLREISQW